MRSFLPLGSMVIDTVTGKVAQIIGSGNPVGEVTIRFDGQKPHESFHRRRAYLKDLERCARIKDWGEFKKDGTNE